MHRGHSWVFRAETHDTMLAWFNDIKELTEKRGEARNEFVRRTHSRSVSGNSLKAPSIGSSEGGMEEDEADRQAFSGEQSVRGPSVAEGMPGVASLAAGAVAGKEVEDTRSEAGWRPPQRPSPGGRFPSEVNMTRGLHAPVSPSSGADSDGDRDAIAAAGALPGSGIPFVNTGQPHTDLQVSGNEGAGAATSATPVLHRTQVHQPEITSNRHDASSQYGEWMAPIAAGAGGAAVGAGVAHHHHHHHQRDPAQPEGQLIEAVDNSERQMEAASPVPPFGTSSVPIPVATADITRSRGMTESTEAPTMASGLAPTASSATDAPTISSTTTTPTEYSARPSLDKVKSSKSVTTISDLPMPGKFPQTPVLQDEPVPNQDVFTR
jgi:hypothetical protein